MTRENPENSSWRTRFNKLPRWSKVFVGIYLIAFCQAFFVHLFAIVQGGINTYSWTPPIVQAYFTALVLLDPFALILILRLRPFGITLSCIVVAIDATANWYINWDWIMADPWRLARPIGLLPITLFALFVLLSAIPMHRTLNRSGNPVEASL